MLEKEDTIQATESLKPINEEKCDEDGQMIFRKRKGTTDVGKIYEDLTVTHFIWDMLHDHEVEDFVVTSNQDQYGDFDDVILHISKKQIVEKYAIQLKHLASDKNVPLTGLTNEKGNFSIKKYYQSYEQHKKNLRDYYIILATNSKLSHTKTHTKLENLILKLTLNETEIKLKLVPHKLSRFQNNCYKFEVCNSEHLHSSHIQFFNHFYLLTNQANVANLKTGLQTEISGKYSNKIFEKFLKFVTNWSVQEGCKTKLYKSLMQQVLGLCLLDELVQPIKLGTNVSKNAQILQRAIQNFDVTTFGEESLDKVVNLWADAQINLSISELNILNRKYQIFQDGKSFKSFDELDLLEKSKLLWIADKCPLVIYKHPLSFEAIELCKSKKFVLIGQLDKCLEHKVFATLQDLETHKLANAVYQNFKCLVPEEINLNYLRGSGNISSDVLLEMVEGPYVLKQEPETFSTIYIDRVLSKILVDVKVLDSLKEEALVVLSGVGDLSSYPYLAKFKTFWLNKSNNTQKLTRSKNLTIYLHSEMCPKATIEGISKKKFHHFKIASKSRYLEWISSTRDISDLQQFCQIAGTETDFCAHNNINIITGDPGMGKSWFLMNLKNKLSQKNFTVLLLPEDMIKLCEYVENSSNPHFHDFLCKYKFNHFSEFDKLILKKLAQDGKVVCLWDALDEINNDRQIEIVTDFIYQLSKNNSLHWITCRRHLRTKIEKKFNVFSRVIREFNNDEQHIYIYNRLKDFYVKADICKITQNIKEHIAFIHFTDVLSIPLQIYMLTEILLNGKEREKFYLLTNTFSIIDVYEYFVQQKFKILYKEKLKIDNNSMSWLQKNDKFKINLYGKAALTVIFENKILETLKIDCKELDDLDDDGCGLLVSSNGNKFQFAHISYAEYFAACYLVKNRSNILKDFLFEEKFTNVRFFFDMLLAKNSPAHQAVLCKNLEVLKKCPHEDILKEDLAGRNLLQVACSWGERYPLLGFSKIDDLFILEQDFYTIKAAQLNLGFLDMIEYLLQKNFNVNSKDQCFQMNFIEYAEVCNCWFTLSVIDKKLQLLYFHSHREAALSLLIYAVLIQFNGTDYVLQQFKSVPNIETQDGKTLLIFASERGNLTVAQLLINAGVNLNATDTFGRTPLHWATHNGHVNVAGFLITSGANVNSADEDEETPLYVASRNGLVKMTQLLINNNANVNAADKDGATPLYVTSRQGYEKVAKLLIINNANLNAANKYGETPLYVASRNGHHKIAKLLIRRGANVNAADKYGESPLYVASRNGHDKVATLLIDVGVNVNTADTAGKTPLFVASQEGHEKVAKLLIDNNANVNAANKVGDTPLSVASQQGHEMVSELLIQKGADVNAAHKDGITPLLVATHNGHEKIATLLINSGANINAAHKDGYTPLYVASLNGHKKVVDLLISKDVNVNAANRDGYTPLYVAAENGHKKVAKLLMAKGANVNSVNKDGLTPLYVASQNGHKNIVRLLINKGADVNAAQRNGYMPLYTASKNGHLNVAHLLIRKGANVNAAAKDGETSLFAALVNGHEKVAELLISNGANVNIAGERW